MSEHLVPEWVGGYVGIPFVSKGRTRDGCDCWGLFRMVAQEQFGIKGLPDYARTYAHANDRASVVGAIHRGLERGWTRSDEASPGALVVLNVMGKPWHTGVAVGGPWMLHTLENVGSALERLDSITWMRRVEGYYRRAR